MVKLEPLHPRARNNSSPLTPAAKRLCEARTSADNSSAMGLRRNVLNQKLESARMWRF
jgi:hypothetical protein